MNNNSEKVKRVLIVEDDPAAREATSMYLEYCGYQVAVANNARSAIAKARDLEPNLLICDWQLGDGDNGVVVARELQKCYGIPVIFMTAHPLDGLYDESADLQVSHYLHKPLSLKELAQAVASIP